MKSAATLNIEINDKQSVISGMTKKLAEIVEYVFAGAGVNSGEISMAIVSDDEMSELNARFFGYNETTDVIAFLYEQSEDGRRIDGEIIVNAMEAVRRSKELMHGTEEELLFYAVHGALHLLGREDSSAEKREAMNRHAALLLSEKGVEIEI